MSKRLIDIDVMQGIAMILVVLGHHYLPFMPNWYFDLHYYLYLFHMPLFICISGFLIRYSYKNITGWREYKSYAGKRIKKFVPMYLLVGLACILLTTKVTDFKAIGTQLLYLFLSPKQGPVIFLWYIYMLLLYYCLAPFLFHLKKIGKIILFFMSLYFYINPIDVSLFCLDYFSKYTVFLFLGFYFAEHYKQLTKLDNVLLIFFEILFIVISICHFQFGYNRYIEYLMPWFAIPAIYWLGIKICNYSFLTKPLTYISINCFSIYLFHMFFVQCGAYVLNLTLEKLNLVSTLIYLLLSIYASIYLSSIIYEKIFKLLKV